MSMKTVAILGGQLERFAHEYEPRKPMPFSSFLDRLERENPGVDVDYWLYQNQGI